MEAKTPREPETDEQRRAAEAERLRETIETWNQFAERRGSFSDDHATL